MKETFYSWGKQSADSSAYPLERYQLPEDFGLGLPVGNRRSYGDSCLNHNGSVFLTRKLNKVLSFDTENGIIRCQAGITFNEILPLIIPQGWFFKVTPGTKHLTVGGALANDVHGKNHLSQGSFGCHVTEFELLRSDGKTYRCSRTENKNLFFSTIGGLGLTGLITWVEFELRKILSTKIETEMYSSNYFENLLDLSIKKKDFFEYSILWIDSFKKFRGTLTCGNHDDSKSELKYEERKVLRVPSWNPGLGMSRPIGRVFNSLRYKKRAIKRQSFDSFFYPLDGLKAWNNLYGRNGFLQYQCRLPMSKIDFAYKLLKLLDKNQISSFLTVIKFFGPDNSGGLLSFPKPGWTISMDFKKEKRVFDLIEKFDQLVLENDGALYPAKDATMKKEMFQKSYPRWKEFLKYKDPKFSSDFWRRVSE